MYQVAALVRRLTAVGFEARPFKNGLEVRLPGCWRRLTVAQAEEFLSNLRAFDDPGEAPFGAVRSRFYDGGRSDEG